MKKGIGCFGRGAKGCLLAITLMGFFGVACADQRGVFPANVPAAYYEECADCHIAFPPDLLPARSWKIVMENLATHYGSNAQMAESTRVEIEHFLVENAGGASLGMKKNGNELYLTQTLWFNRMHGKTKSRFNETDVGGSSHCGSCHLRAAEGLFHENRIPP